MARPKKNPDVATLTCQTCHKEFQVKWQKRNKQRFCSKTCSVNNPEVKEKNRSGVKAAFDEKYGGHPMAVNPATVETFKESMKEKYGVEHPAKMDGFSVRVKATKKERYGDENYNNFEQIKATLVEKYGKDNFRKTDGYKTRYKETCLKKYGIDHASKSSEYKDSHKRTMFEKFTTSDRFQNFVPKFSFDEYDGVTKKYNKPYMFECKRCGMIEGHNLANGLDVRCSRCDKTMSGFQLEVVEFVKQLLPGEPVVTNNRVILAPLELDIYIPSKNLAIETDGLYWHTEVSGGKNKNYHLNKTKLAASKGIRLIHIFENEWKHKPEIVKSVLRSMLAKENEIIYARKCDIRPVPTTHKTKFLEENHLQGQDHATVKLGLYHKNELVSLMTFVKSRFDKKVEWEMSRFCTKRGVTVIGGSSRLFKCFVEEHKPNSVVSYSDRRYFSGETYLKLGFEFVDNTPPNYHYIIDGYSTLQSRINWQKAKLDKKLLTFDPKLSEWENMRANGFDRIWDCGHSKWVWTKK
jgi:hypothetical protein